MHTLVGKTVPADHLFWTADVAAMYTSIPLEDLIADALTWLAQPEYYFLPPDAIRYLLHVVLKVTLLVRHTRGHAPRYYTQKNGVPMGSAAAPVLAVLFVTKFETAAWRTHPAMQYYGRYIDDLFGETS